MNQKEKTKFAKEMLASIIFGAIIIVVLGTIAIAVKDITDNFYVAIASPYLLVVTWCLYQIVKGKWIEKKKKI